MSDSDLESYHSTLFSPAALYEHLASFRGGPPNAYHFALYSEWAKHSWGMILTGNVQVSQSHLSLGRDMVIPQCVTGDSLRPFKELADAIHGIDDAKHDDNFSSATKTRYSALAIMQLSHSGRQSPNFLGGRLPFVSPLAPSSIAMGTHKGNMSGNHSETIQTFLSKLLYRLLFLRPREMSLDDIENVLHQFVRGARVAFQSGFDGVQLHAAHGYLLAQFMSPKSNQRCDEYSADGDNALRLLHRIIVSIRDAVPSSFVVGVKINATDFVDSNGTAVNGTSDHDALNHVHTIASWGLVDFLEISGGDYENPDFLSSSHPSSSSPRQAIFSKFAKQAVQVVQRLDSPPPSSRLLIMLTGGLTSPAHLHAALASRHADLVGIGRAAVMRPDLPIAARKVFFSQSLGNEQKCFSYTKPFAVEPDLESAGTALERWIWSCLPKVKLIGAGVVMAWHLVAMRQLALINRCKRDRSYEKNIHYDSGSHLDYSIGALQSVLRMWIWLDVSAHAILYVSCGILLPVLAFIIQWY